MHKYGFIRLLQIARKVPSTLLLKIYDVQIRCSLIGLVLLTILQCQNPTELENAGKNMVSHDVDAKIP